MANQQPIAPCGVCLEDAPLVLWHAHATACLPCSESFLTARLDDARNAGAFEGLERCGLAPGCTAPLTVATLPAAFSPALRARLARAEGEARRMHEAIESAARAGFAGLSAERFEEIARWRVADPRNNTVCPHCFVLTFRTSGCNHSAWCIAQCP
jgi:hypothetical protein